MGLPSDEKHSMLQPSLLQGIPVSNFLKLRRRNLPLLLALCLVTFFASYSFFGPSTPKRPISSTISSHQKHDKHAWHPIDDLIKEGEQQLQSLLAEQTHDVNSAAAAYR